MSIWKRAIVWTKIKDSLALGGILGQAGMEVLSTSELIKLWVAVGTVLGYLVGMWMEDRDKDGIVDLFQSEVVTTIKSDSPITVETEVKKQDE